MSVKVDKIIRNIKLYYLTEEIVDMDSIEIYNYINNFYKSLKRYESDIKYYTDIIFYKDTNSKLSLEYDKREGSLVIKNAIITDIYDIWKLNIQEVYHLLKWYFSNIFESDIEIIYGREYWVEERFVNNNYYLV